MIKSSGSTRRAKNSNRILKAAVLATPAVAAAIAFVSPAKAATLYWDLNGTTAGGAAGTTAVGTWSGVDTNWNTDSLGGAGTISAWPGSGNAAVFAAGTGVTGAYTVTVSGTQSVDNITFEEGQVTLTGGELALGSTTIHTSSNAASITHTINSVISGTNGLTRTAGFVGGVGTPTLVLTAANTYSGITNLAGTSLSGVTRITNASALGVAGALGSGNETVFAAGSTTDGGVALARLDLAGGIDVVGESVTVTSGGGRSLFGQLSSASGLNTWSGNIRMSGSGNNEGTGLASIGAQAGQTLVVNGATISSPGATSTSNGSWWAKTGLGTVVLRNTTTTTLGSIRVLNGLLVVESDAALGPAPVGTFGQSDINQCVLIAALSGNTPTVGFAGNVNYTTARYIRTAGTTGFGSTATTAGIGEIASISGNNTFAGDININLGTAIGAASGSSLELTGNIWGAATTARLLQKVGTGELIISGTNTAANGLVGTSNGGNVNFGITAGTITVAAGTLTLRNNPGTGGTGSMSGGVGFQVNPGATLSLDNSLGVNTARIGTGAPIVVAGGEVKLIGNDTTTVSQTAGTLQVAGFSKITVVQPSNTNSSTTTFALGTLTRSNRGTALLRGMDNSASYMGLAGTLKGGGGSSGSPTISILPEVIGDAGATGPGTDFVTIESGFARILTAGEYTTLTSGLTDTVNTTVASASTISADTTVNSLKITGGNTLTIDSTKFLYLRSGALLGVGSGTSNIDGGTLKFENTTIATDEESGITSLIGASEEGIITVPLNSTLAVSSTITGGLGLTKSGEGVLTLTGTNLYGNNAGYTTINAGVVQISQDVNLGDATGINGKVVLNGGDLAVLASHSTSRNFELQSPVALANGIDVAASQAYTINGVVSGVGQLTKKGAGNLILTNTNTYTGSTNIQAGQVSISAAGQVSNTLVNLNGGALHVTANSTILNQVSVNNATGGIRVDPGVVAVFGTAVPTSTQGQLIGAANLLLDGGGTFNPIANNNYSGDQIITNGSTIRYTISQGRGVPPGVRAGYLDLDAGTVQVVGQATNPNTGTNGISTFSANVGVTLRAGGGTFDIQTGATAAGTYMVSFLGTIAGSGDLTKIGSGTTLSIGTANTYTGKTKLQAGAIRITGDTGLGAAPAALDTSHLQMTGGTRLTVVGNTTLHANRGIQILGGGTATITTGTNTVTIASPISESGGTANLTRDGAGTVILTGVSSYAGVTNVVGGGTGVGATGASVLRLGVNNALPAGTTLNLNALSATGAAVFDLGTAATGFNQTVAAIVNSGPAGSSPTVTQSGSVPATFTVANAATNTWSGKFTGSNLQVNHSSAGTLVMTGAGNNFGGLNGTGNATVGDGTTGITATAGHWRAGTLTVAAGSVITNTVSGAGGGFAGGQDSGTNKVVSLALGANKFDIADNKLITGDAIGTHNGTNYDGITGLIETGRNGGVWNGNGITTSMPDATGGSGYTSLGVATGSEARGIGASDTDLWGGQTVTGSDSLVMYTYGGDANLSGNVDIDDYGQIDFNASTGGVLTGWYNGDFDYNGVQDIDDYGVIDFVVGIQGNPFKITGGSEGGMSIAAVPEPASFGLVSLGVIGLVARRNRRKM